MRDLLMKLNKWVEDILAKIMTILCSIYSMEQVRQILEWFMRASSMDLILDCQMMEDFMVTAYILLLILAILMVTLIAADEVWDKCL